MSHVSVVSRVSWGMTHRRQISRCADCSSQWDAGHQADIEEINYGLENIETDARVTTDAGIDADCHRAFHDWDRHGMEEPAANTD